MKKSVGLSIFLWLTMTGTAQLPDINNLRHEINAAKDDTIRLILLNNFARFFAEINPDSAYHYSEKAVSLARVLNLKLEEERALREMGYAFLNLGNYPRSLQMLLSAIDVASDPKSENAALIIKTPGDDAVFQRSASPRAQRLGDLAFAYQTLGILYFNAKNYDKTSFYYFKALQLARESGNIPVEGFTVSTLGRLYLDLKKIDSALIYVEEAYELDLKSGYKKYRGSFLLNLGRVWEAKGNAKQAFDFYLNALKESREQNYFRGIVASNLLLATYYNHKGITDSAFDYMKDALVTAEKLNLPDLQLRSYTALADHYKTANKNDSAVKYQSLIIKINETLFNTKKTQDFQNIEVDERQKQQQKEEADRAFKNRIKTYGLVTALSVFLIIAFIFWRNDRQKQRANILLKQQNEKIETTLRELRSAQSQLIQSEKMASLGELTAGIAHEIQNPLNFVNNFSEINKELITEMKVEIDKGNFDGVKLIANTIEDNQEKIYVHGKRAETIVNGMLQHTRTSTGHKELTDINALTGEYARLAYNGLRAKDKFLKAILKTDFDDSIQRINVIRQDIGKAVINLTNNAFYAVREKKKTAGPAYEPVVTASTKNAGNSVEITVKDNGIGIARGIVDKIFQPFFTTKPAGQGTGLGLSLSYDIIKAHGGEIKVNSVEGEFTEFIIRIPV